MKLVTAKNNPAMMPISQLSNMVPKRTRNRIPDPTVIAICIHPHLSFEPTMKDLLKCTEYASHKPEDQTDRTQEHFKKKIVPVPIPMKRLFTMALLPIFPSSHSASPPSYSFILLYPEPGVSNDAFLETQAWSCRRWFSSKMNGVCLSIFTHTHNRNK